jgi:chemotaxis protein methyltransferase CheR
MIPGEVREAQWLQLSNLIAERMGLHFPRERWDDLQRGLAGAAQEFGFADAGACVSWLMSAPPTQAQIEVLASHLTVGETYFYRDTKTLEALAQNILPDLIRARRGREQRLRFWSAACCSGEEPYSLAILLHRLLPDMADWRVTITATDINPRFLHKAVAGKYGEWSFRNAPPWLKARYFDRTADGRYTIVPEIGKMVTFAHLNLVEDVYPSLATDTNAMDIIFCRNVMMYFTPPQRNKLLGKLHHALVDGGWLAVSPSETSHTLFPQFVPVNFPGAIFYQKSDARPSTEQRPTPAPCSAIAAVFAPAIEPPSPSTPAVLSAKTRPLAPANRPAAAESEATAAVAAELLYQQNRYAEAADTMVASLTRHAPDREAFSLLARALANQGKLADALTWCERWIDADKIDPAGHYLRAVVLLEQGDPQQARVCLQRALYLDPDFVLAHFALGNLARSRGKSGESNKHFDNTLKLLRAYRSDDLLPESDGLTAGRLTETLTAITGSGMSP